MNNINAINRVSLLFAVLFSYNCLFLICQNVLAADIKDTPRFFQLLDDVPLMPGLEEVPELSVYFDKPEGRIVESVAILGHLSQKDVLVYYTGTLTQMGWGIVDKDSFFRDRERLDITFEQQNGIRYLKVSINPSL